MSSPKILRILEIVADRVARISPGEGYFSNIGCDVRLDQREPELVDLPCALVFLSPAEIVDAQNRRAVVEQSITVIGYVAPGAQAAQVAGWQVIADLQRAIEIDSNTLVGLIHQSRGDLIPQSFAVTLPDPGVNAVAAQITYAAPTVRLSGDPELI